MSWSPKATFDPYPTLNVTLEVAGHHYGKVNELRTMIAKLALNPPDDLEQVIRTRQLVVSLEAEAKIHEQGHARAQRALTTTHRRALLSYDYAKRMFSRGRAAAK